jgi:hypothetical protein
VGGEVFVRQFWLVAAHYVPASAAEAGLLLANSRHDWVLRMPCTHLGPLVVQFHICYKFTCFPHPPLSSATHSYGYHGDDGNAFCGTGTGDKYGPTFTTGDTIGCCVNFMDSTCFFTKNGAKLPVAFRNVGKKEGTPSVPLFPCVGLQTVGEEIVANFGEEPFVFDLKSYRAGTCFGF